MANSAITPRKNCWVHGLHKIFANINALKDCVVTNDYKDYVNEYTTIYVLCDSMDESIFGEKYMEGTKWIIANKTIFGGNDFDIKNLQTELNNRLKVSRIYQSEYDDLVNEGTVDEMTLYIIKPDEVVVE